MRCSVVPTWLELCIFEVLIGPSSLLRFAENERPKTSPRHSSSSSSFKERDVGQHGVVGQVVLGLTPGLTSSGILRHLVRRNADYDSSSSDISGNRVSFRLIDEENFDVLDLNDTSTTSSMLDMLEFSGPERSKRRRKWPQYVGYGTPDDDDYEDSVGTTQGTGNGERNGTDGGTLEDRDSGGTVGAGGSRSGGGEPERKTSTRKPKHHRKPKKPNRRKLATNAGENESSSSPDTLPGSDAVKGRRPDVGEPPELRVESSVDYGASSWNRACRELGCPSTAHCVSDTLRAGRPRCRCSLGTGGRRCEQGGAGLRTFSAFVEFRPETNNGLLLFSADRPDAKYDFFSVSIVDGKAEFSDLTADDAINRSERPPSLGNEHFGSSVHKAN